MGRVTLKAFEKARDGIAPSGVTKGQCLCGKVQVEINLPVFWACTTIRGQPGVRTAPPMRPMSEAGAAASG